MRKSILFWLSVLAASLTLTTASTASEPCDPADPICVIGTDDTTPPTISSLTVSPASVDTSESGQQIVVTSDLQDNLSGVATAMIDFRSPSGNQGAGITLNNLVSGTRNEGEFRGATILPQYSEQGRWTISSVRLFDNAGNLAFLAGDQITDLGFDDGFNQTGTDDTTSPTISSLTISPTSVDTSESGRQIVVTADLQDNLSGVATAMIDFRSPSGNQGAGITLNNLVSGTRNNGTFRGTTILPHYSERGRWTVQNIRLFDNAGNLAFFNSAQVAELGLDDGFDQTGTDDTTSPTISSLTISPAAVDTSESGQQITVTADLQDNLSGLATAVVDFWAPSRNQGASVTLNNLISGTRGNGTFRGTTILPRYAEQGHWAIQTIRLFDNAGNLTVLTGDQLTELGIGAGIDVNPPVVVCDQSPQGWQAGNVQVNCAASDSQSGLADPSDVEFTLSTSVPAGAETANASTGSRQVCNVAGSCAVAGPISGIKVDRRAPAISINSPSEGSTVGQGSVLTADYICEDTGSGVASCSGDIASGSPIDTSSAGPRSFSVTATDHAGNTRSVTIDFTVVEATEPVEPGAYSAGVLADEPVSYWRLGSGGGTIADELGGHQGEFKNGAAAVDIVGVGGEHGAAHFSGNGTHGYINGFPAPTGPYTLEIWAKAADQGDGMLIQQGGAGALFIRDGKYVFRQVDTNIVASTGPATDRFDHIIGTWDGQVARIYVNGTLAGSAAATKPPSGNATIFIGYGDQAPWFRGYLDEAAYYGHALDPGRVAAHFAAGIHVAPVSNPSPAPDLASASRKTEETPASQLTDSAVLPPASTRPAGQETPSGKVHQTRKRKAKVRKARARAKCKRISRPGKRRSCLRRVNRTL